MTDVKPGSDLYQGTEGGKQKYKIENQKSKMNSRGKSIKLVINFLITWTANYQPGSYLGLTIL